MMVLIEFLQQVTGVLFWFLLMGVMFVVDVIRVTIAIYYLNKFGESYERWVMSRRAKDKKIGRAEQ